MLALLYELAILILVGSTTAQLSTGNGVVGLGRDLFQPTCCYACVDSLWSLQLPCSQPDEKGRPFSSPQCHGSDQSYLGSLAYCMQQKCGLDGVSTVQVEQCWNEIAGDGMPVGSYESNLPQSRPTYQLAYNATVLNETAVVNESLYVDSRNTIISYGGQESDHALYSTIIIACVVGFCILAGCAHVKASIAPHFHLLPQSLSTFLDRIVLVPAVFGGRHIQKLPGNIGYLPRRSTTLLLTAYLVLNVVFAAISYPLSTNNTWYVDSSKESLGYVANRLGVLCIANVALLFMFSGRNTLLLYITQWSRTDLIVFHRWIGRVAVLEGVIHGAMYWSSTDQYGTSFFTAAAGLHYIGYGSSYWTMGIAAMVGMVFIAVLSILPIRAYAHEAFLIVHIGLAIIVLVTLRYHLSLRFNGNYGYEIWLYLAFALWGFDRIVRVARIAFLNWSMLAGRKSSARVELLPGNEFIKVTVWPSIQWNVTPGQYAFIHFPTLTAFLESHPFSIAFSSNSTKASESPTTYKSPSSTRHKDIEMQPLPTQHDSLSTTPTRHPRSRTNSIRSSSRPSISFIIRPEAGLTHNLQQRLLSRASSRRNSRSHSHSLSIPVLLEGPYGFSAREVSGADTVVAFAGGIGITCILGYVSEHLARGAAPAQTQTQRCSKKMLVVWAVRERSLVEAVVAGLPSEAHMAECGVRLRIACREMGHARLELGSLLRGEVRALGADEAMAVVVCGPGRMADEVRAGVVDCLGLYGKRVRLVEEVFAW